MKMNKILAAMAATVVSVSSMAVMSLSASAAEKTIAYTDGGIASMGKDNDGISVRKNIYNTWGNNVTDIDSANPVNKYITVDFTVSGIGDKSTNYDEAGNATDAFFVYLAGSVGTNGSWNKADDTCPCDHVAITGDGDYSVTWNLNEGSDTIDCLILQSNINMYGFEGTDETYHGINFTINSIKTDDGAGDSTEAPTTTTAADNNSTATTTAAGATTTKADDKAAATTTKAAATTAKPAATTAKPAASEASASTGDAGVGVVFTVIAAAGAAAFVSRKKN